jgi:hypothetical protein
MCGTKTKSMVTLLSSEKIQGMIRLITMLISNTIPPSLPPINGSSLSHSRFKFIRASVFPFKLSSSSFNFPLLLHQSITIRTTVLIIPRKIMHIIALNFAFVRVTRCHIVVELTTFCTRTAFSPSVYQSFHT